MSAGRRSRWLLVAVFLAGLIAGWWMGRGNVLREIALWWQNRDAVVAPTHELVRSSFGDAIYAGNLEARELEEVSGLAHSAQHPNRLWAINDSGGEPALYALGHDGGAHGKVRVQEAENVDWEALARFEYEGAPYLLIGDIGDNLAVRDHVSFYAVAEPRFEDDTLPRDASAPLAFRIDARYDEGPRDAEAMAIDPLAQQILILSKRSQPPELYALSLEPGEKGAIRTAQRLGRVETLPAPNARDLEEGGFLGRFRSQPTALRISEDGKSAIVLTYKHAYEYPRQAGESWVEAFARSPREIPLPPLHQAEAAALEPGTGALWVTSENHPAPLFRVPHRP